MYIYIQIVCNECEASINLQMSHLDCKILLKNSKIATEVSTLFSYSCKYISTSLSQAAIMSIDSLGHRRRGTRGAGKKQQKNSPEVLKRGNGYPSAEV